MWDALAEESVMTKTIASLGAHGMTAIVVKNKEEAKAKVMELIPKGAEVMTMSSMTLDTIGITAAINDSKEYNAVKPKLMAMDRKTQGLAMQKLGAAPEWCVGSIHAVTEQGEVMIASNTGSQLSAYVYGAAHVIWVVGTQKIVKNLDEGSKRIYEYCLPNESVRMQKAYGMPSNVGKILIIKQEIKEGRITVIFVKETVGM